MEKNLLKYVTPQVRVVQFRVEHGFAGTLVVDKAGESEEIGIQSYSTTQWGELSPNTTDDCYF